MCNVEMDVIARHKTACLIYNFRPFIRKYFRFTVTQKCSPLSCVTFRLLLVCLSSYLLGKDEMFAKYYKILLETIWIQLL